MEKALSSINDDGFILTREENIINNENVSSNLLLSTEHKIENEILYLLKKAREETPSIAIDISNSLNEFSWLPAVQNATKTGSDVILYSQGQSKNGILGLVNCLRKEENGDKIKCLFLDETAPKFDLTSQFYKNQLSKDLAVNVYRNSQWGTYRHLLLDFENITAEHCYVNVTTPGDLTSLTWVEGAIDAKQSKEETSAVVNVMMLRKFNITFSRFVF